MGVHDHVPGGEDDALKFDAQGKQANQECGDWREIVLESVGIDQLEVGLEAFERATTDFTLDEEPIELPQGGAGV